MTVADLWAAATATQPPATAAVVVGSAVAVLVVLAVPRLWHLVRHGLTIVHEAGHGAAALLVGRRLAGIRVHSDTSGLTVTVGRARGPGMVATLLAGYPAPALVGLGAAALLAAGRPAAVLWLLLLLVVLVLLQIRNLYGLGAVLVTGALLALLTVRGSAWTQAVAAHAVTWFLLLGAARAVLELGASRRRLRRGGRPDTSDAGQLARLTGVPAGAWVAVLLLGCVACLALGGRWLLAAAG